LKSNVLAMMSPLCLCLLASNARAALEPFTLGASETVKHESNINHGPDGAVISDWLSTTEFTAALDEAVGRSKLLANAGVNYNAYKDEHHLDYFGYHAGAELDWETIGDLAGSLGASTSRKRYVYGVTSDPGLLGSTASTTERNMQTDNRVFARAELGGPARWQIYGGADASQRRFSASDFQGQDERQWSSNFGTRYSTSPDLAFGVEGNYSHGEYPHVVVAEFAGVPITAASKFNSRSIDATVRLKATGNSGFDARLGYTTESSDALSKDAKFVNGALNWTWTPPSHFAVRLGLKRSADIDNQMATDSIGLKGSNLNGVSVNNVASLDVTYELTAKISLDANTSYSQRKYSDVRQLIGPDLAGTVRTTNFFLSVNYLPTRTTTLSCGAGREHRRADSAIALSLPSYADNTVQCMGSIKFD